MTGVGFKFTMLSVVIGVALAQLPPGEPRYTTPNTLTEKGDQSGAKPPWEWTIEERLSARFDPGNMRSRREADEAVRLTHYKAMGRTPAPTRADDESRCVVHGNLNPELLMPSELFGQLISKVFSEKPDVRLHFRNVFRNKAWPPRVSLYDWALLESVVAPYLSAEKEGRALIDKSPRSSPELELKAQLTFKEFSLAQCARRAAALEAARATFGREQFDRFLYEGVAPLISVSGTNTAADHRRAEAGCR